MVMSVDAERQFMLEKRRFFQKITLTKEYCREIIKMLRTCNITAVFEEENRVFFDEELPDHKILHDLRARFGTKAFDIPKSLEDGEILFDKFVVWVNTVSDYKMFYNYISEKFDCIDRGAGMYEIVPKGYFESVRYSDAYGLLWNFAGRLLCVWRQHERSSDASVCTKQCCDGE